MSESIVIKEQVGVSVVGLEVDAGRQEFEVGLNFNFDDDHGDTYVCATLDWQQVEALYNAIGAFLVGGEK